MNTAILLITITTVGSTKKPTQISDHRNRLNVLHKKLTIFYFSYRTNHIFHLTIKWKTIFVFLPKTK